MPFCMQNVYLNLQNRTNPKITGRKDEETMEAGERERAQNGEEGEILYSNQFASDNITPSTSSND